MKTSNPATCCCCFSLRTGTLIIGWLTVVGTCYNIIKEIIQMATFDVHTAIADPTVKAVHGGCSQDDDCQAFVYKTVMGLCAFILGWNLIALGLSFSLILGVNQKRPKFMTPYLGYLGFCTFIFIVIWVFALILLFNDPATCVILSVIMALIVALYCHFFTVIRGHQNEIIAEQGSDENEHSTPKALEAGLDSVTKY